MRYVTSVVYLLVTTVSPANTAELIEMPLGRQTQVCPWNYVLNGGTYGCHLANTI